MACRTTAMRRCFFLRPKEATIFTSAASTNVADGLFATELTPTTVARRRSLLGDEAAFTGLYAGAQQRWLSSSEVTESESAKDPNQASTEEPFQSARVEEVYHRLIRLNEEERKMIRILMNDRLGLNIPMEILEGGPSAVEGGEAAEQAEAAAPEKTIFDVKLTGFDAKAKIKVIKEVRAITGLGLKEAKETVENVPYTVKKDMKEEDAQELKAKLEEVGAIVEIV